MVEKMSNKLSIEEIQKALEHTTGIVNMPSASAVYKQLLDTMRELEVANSGIDSFKKSYEMILREKERLLKSLEETTEVLECLRRGHGVTVSGMCYPALNNARDTIQSSKHSVVECPRCFGTKLDPVHGTIKNSVQCIACGGSGQ